MKKKLLISFVLLSSVLTINAQQIGNGRALILFNFGDTLKSGVYNGYNTLGSVPDDPTGWQHLFVIRHPDLNNNHQFQLGTAFTENDRLFFRKIVVGTPISRNPSWIELATRGTNDFIGDQIVKGNLSLSPVGTVSDEAYNGNLMITKPLTSGQYINLVREGNFPWSIGMVYNTSTFAIGTGKFDNSAFASPQFVLTPVGNVGIGTINPVYKLDVIGTIRASEIKVDLEGADFVFDKDYKLMPLSELETFIKDAKHLPEVATAKEMKEKGTNLGDLNIKLLQKIEELTLYTINQSKKIDGLTLNTIEQSKEIEKQNDVIRILLNKIEKIENNSDKAK